MDKIIYLDNAATTRVDPEVLEAMMPYFTEQYANPSAIYSFSQKVKREIEDARDEIAKIINAKSNEIYFTAGGSESNNWAIKEVARAYKNRGKHIISSKIEHHSVLHTLEFLEREGYEVTYLEVDEFGKISLEELKSAIRKDTILISIMTANNEIGTIQPILEIGNIAKENNIIFHTDAVQAFGHISLDVVKMNIDLLSISAHKLHGPKGVGALYINKNVRIRSFIHGGAQERQRRAGTHNVPAIVGFGKAVKIAGANMSRNIQYVKELRDYFLKKILEEVPYVKINGDLNDRLPNNINVSFRFVEGESLLILLDQSGICASSGSACTSGSLDPSHVLLAIGLPHEIAHGSLRITLSQENTMEELDYTIEKIKGIVERLRRMSPLYEDYLLTQKNS